MFNKAHTGYHGARTIDGNGKKNMVTITITIWKSYLDGNVGLEFLSKHSA